MANEKISQLVPTADFGGSWDWMLISKNLGAGLYESQKIAPDNIFYDSGFTALNVFNGSFGLADIGATVLNGLPEIRVQNRKAYIVGNLILPLADGDDLLNDDINTYPTFHHQKLWGGLAGGFEEVISTSDLRVSRHPIVPAALRPNNIAFIGNLVPVHRIIEMNGPRVDKYVNNSFLSAWLLADGKLLLGSIYWRDQAESVTPLSFEMHHLNAVASKYNLSQKMDDYSAWYQSIGSRNYTDTGDVYPMTHDATKCDNLGGYELWMNLCYDLNQAYTIEQIKAGFDSII